MSDIDKAQLAALGAATVRDPLTDPVRGDVISYRVEADDMFSAGTSVLVVTETVGRWVSARGLKLSAYWSEVADGCVVGTTTAGDVVRSPILQSYEDRSVRFDPTVINAAPQTDPWGALCARLSLDTSASVEAVIAAARGRDAQPPPVRSERSVDVAPGIVALLRARTEQGALHGAEVAAAFDDRVKLGIQRYGVALTTFNGRDAQVDALDEALDGIQYAEQLALELEEMDPQTVGVERFRFAQNAAEDARDHFIRAAMFLVRARELLR